MYRFAQALDVWRHPFWETYAHDDLDEYCAFVREHTDLRLGIEADFVPGAEDRMANLLEARDFDYVVGSVHFMRDGAVDMDDYSVWDSNRARSAEEVWTRYFQAIAEAARSGLFDIAAHPDLVKYLGAMHGARRKATCAATTSPPSKASPKRASPSRSRPRGCASPSARSTRRARSWRCAWKRACRVALSSDAHRPEDVGAGYERALEELDAVGVRELCVFERRQRRLEPIGAAQSTERARGPGRLQRSRVR